MILIRIIILHLKTERKHMEYDDKKVPKTIQEEPNDEPAGFTIPWTMIIAIVVLVILYFIIF